MSTQIHMRHGNGEYNNSYAHVDAFVDNRDAVIHAKGSCDSHMRKDGEKMINDYNLDINKPKINGHTLTYENMDDYVHDNDLVNKTYVDNAIGKAMEGEY